MVDLDPEQMFAKNVSPSDVSNAFNAQNVILPAGTAKMGEREYNVRLNSSPTVVDQLNDLPIKQVNGAMVYLRDVAHVRQGAAVQTNTVRRNGQPSALLTVLKSGSASTLSVVSNVIARMPSILATLPPSLKLDFLFDQSLFVRASISGVVREAVIAACLTGLMILMFLGSWRSTLIVITSIPLSILSSIIVLSFLGETLNIMTLGGLALAVGMLVDDATVGAGRDAGVRLDAVDLHRLRLGNVSDRSCQITLHTAGAGGGVCDASLVSAVAHSRAHDDSIHVAERGCALSKQRRS